MWQRLKRSGEICLESVKVPYRVCSVSQRKCLSDHTHRHVRLARIITICSPHHSSSTDYDSKSNRTLDKRSEISISIVCSLTAVGSHCEPFIPIPGDRDRALTPNQSSIRTY